MKSAELSIRPYARLLTMLGDQLIKNERIALLELIKNAYDADANWVRVSFEDFNDDMSAKNDSWIRIEDDGHGMAPEVIHRSWMNPANPEKYINKQKGKNRTPEKKRIVQGEKGIGRFAVLKLGNMITVTTRTEGADFESVLLQDFRPYDADFTSEHKKDREVFLDEIKAIYSENSSPETILKRQGTSVEIRNLKGAWSERAIERLIKDVSVLTDPVTRITRRESLDDFRIDIVCNGKIQSIEDKNEDDLKCLLEDKPVLKINGEFSAERNSFLMWEQEAEDNRWEIRLEDSKIRALWIWKQTFDDDDVSSGGIECGDFKFHFYIFDFSRGITGKYELHQSEKNILKEHRIYLYRDEVRVYPYGDPDDDWLNIDVSRGTGRAGDFFSNDQVIGWIDITHEKNPKLRDKTNREGLIEEGNTVNDFIGLIRTILSYIKQYPYARYQQKNKDRSDADIVRNEVVSSRLATLRTNLEKQGHASGVREVARIEKIYKKEKDHLVQRTETVEDLAGVGLSVEMASHDIMLMMSRTMEIGKELSRLSRKLENDEIQQRSDMLVGILAQIADSLKDVQSLFKSARRRKKALRIEPILNKIYQLYQSLLEKRGIRYEKFVVPGSPLVADTNDGVVMQVLINLFDNASYWLDIVDRKEKEIKIIIDGTKGELIFSDNGPGIDEDDLDYIFEPFYSGKGEEGRGLGLYIARQLLERHDYQISVDDEKQRKLPGANFVVSFVKEGT